MRVKSQALIFAFLPFFLGGCASKNLSNRDPMYRYAGQTVSLLPPVSVVGRYGPWALTPNGVLAFRSVEYGIVDISGHPNGLPLHGPVYAELPAGHKVKIDCVRQEGTIDDVQVIVYGHTTIPPNKKEVSFAYPWGDGGSLWRAPWEPDNTVERVSYESYGYYNPPRADAPKWGAEVKQ